MLKIINRQCKKEAKFVIIISLDEVNLQVAKKVTYKGENI